MTAQGMHALTICSSAPNLPTLRITAALTRATDLMIRSCRAISIRLDRPAIRSSRKGSVEAAQRGLDSRLIYFHLDAPAFGSVLAFQKLTALNG